jgi:Chaperone for flagella basal body P-ring formation
MRTLLSFYVLLVLCFVAPASHAQSVVEVDHGLVRLGHVWSAAPRELSDFEVAVAPPAGSSRLLAKKELVARLTEQGVSTKGLALPLNVRIKTRSQTWSFEQIEAASREGLVGVLERGVVLVRVRARGGILVPAGTVAGPFELPKLPRRAGEVTVSGVLPLKHGSEVVQRVPVTLVLTVSPAAAAPLIRRGSVLQLVVMKSSAQISALAEALADADAGETIQFRVQSTRRVVQGIVQSQHKALVVMQ